ncbi:MAG: N-acetylglucosamine transferase [Alphaproteobacteria bacterium]|nr:MAG: N-acetylglucosamine transferase [Alphaproteobacteria bacterium]
MTRLLHRYIALPGSLLLLLLTLSGAVLSVLPALEVAQSAAMAPGETVADLAAKVQANLPEVQQIKVDAAGNITAYYFAGLSPAAKIIDPATGGVIGDKAATPVKDWLVDLHRSLFLGSGGRITAGVGAAMMVLLALTGIFLMARRMGGWRKFFAPARGPLSARLHVEFSRIALLGLVFSGATGIWITLTVFDVIPAFDPTPVFPDQVSGQIASDISALPALRDIPLTELKALTFPYAGDATDVFTVETTGGMGYVDQGTGEMLSFEAPAGFAQVNALIYALHTGRGLRAWALGLVLGLASLAGALLTVTGVLVWLRGRKSSAPVKGFDRAGRAETIILVGSEGGSTWGFAATLGAALKDAGQSVHIGPMSAFNPARWPQAKRLIVLAATYGNGDAPQSAKGFLEALERHGAKAERLPVAVLGFGDRSYEKFCGFGEEVRAAFERQGWPQLVEMERIDRQSPQAFRRWGRALGAALGLELDLNHVPSHPPTRKLTLISRQDYGLEFQEPTAILRFALPQRTLWEKITGQGWPRFSAGDLLGVVPEGDSVPRFYSLASSSRDGFVEICVKKHAGGLCSGQLHRLAPGDSIDAFIRPNPDFAPQRKGPVVLIGAGTGIGPLAGFIRGNCRRKPMHLYFGVRHPQSDLLYGEALEEWAKGGQLTSHQIAFSRLGEKTYVQDLIRRDAARLVELANAGAQFLVCGGRGMADGVQAALAEALAPVGLTPAQLKAEGRYVEDVY